MLGYTQVSWDDETGLVRVPLAARKPWNALTGDDKIAASLLGYTQTSWDNLSGTEPQPNVFNKQWSELATCEDGAKTFALPHSLFSFQATFSLVVSAAHTWAVLHYINDFSAVIRLRHNSRVPLNTVLTH